MVEEEIARTLCRLLKQHKKNSLSYVDDLCLDDVCINGTFDVLVLVRDLILQFNQYTTKNLN